MNTSPRKRVRLDPDARRRKILDEAVHLIGEHGFYGFGLRDLADRCQLSGGGLLHYFESKEALLIALLKDRDDQVKDSVYSRTRSRIGDDASEFTASEVRDIFHWTVVRNSTQPEFVRLYVTLRAEALKPEHPAHEYFMSRQRFVIESYSSLVAPHVEHPGSVGLQLVATMEGLEQEWLRSALRFDLVAEWDRAFDRIFPARSGA